MLITATKRSCNTLTTSHLFPLYTDVACFSEILQVGLEMWRSYYISNLACTNPWGQCLTPNKLGMAVHAYNSSTRQVETEDPKVQVSPQPIPPLPHHHPGLHNKFKTSLGLIEILSWKEIKNQRLSRLTPSLGYKSQPPRCLHLEME